MRLSCEVTEELGVEVAAPTTLAVEPSAVVTSIEPVESM